MRRKLAGDRLRCWLSDNEHKRWSGQGTWNRDREKGVENSRERIKSWEIDALVVGCVWELDFPRSSCWSLQLAGEQPQLQADRQLSRSCSKSLLSAGWEGGSSGYGSNWGNCVSLSILVVMLKNQVAPHQLQAQLHLGRSSKFSFWNESKIWLQIFDVPQPSVWFGQRINAKMGFRWWSGCVCVGTPGESGDMKTLQSCVYDINGNQCRCWLKILQARFSLIRGRQW